MKTILIVLLTCTILFGYGQNYSENWTDINYAGDGQAYHNLDIYLPAEVKDSYPVVIYVYGSAWLSNNGKGADMGTVGAALLDAGYAVVTPNHRSSGDAIFPAQINDIKAVVRFVRGTASNYKFDTSFIAISGSSSGGHLSALTGTTNGLGTYTVGSATADIEGNLGQYTDFSSSVDAVVDWFGPTDLSVISSCINGDGFDHDGPSSPGSAIIGAPLLENPDKVALLNPVTYIDPTDPPFLMFHGDADNVVPYCQSELLYNALQDKGVESEYVFVPGGGHGPNTHTTPNFEKMVDFLNQAKEAKNSGFSLTVNGGSGSGTYRAGATVTIKATEVPDGKAFSKWTGNDAGLLDDLSASETTFIMPEKDVDLTASYIDAFTLTITSPANGASVPAGSDITVHAEIGSTTSTINTLEFIHAGKTIGEDNTAPYSFIWEDVAEGIQTLTLRATDMNGIVVEKSISVNVYIPQGPYNGIAHTIPGLIEFEEFDTGGQDSAYFDDSPGNDGGANFRTDEDVDIEDCTDSKGDYNIGFSTSGEWLEYTVNVSKTGTYKLHLRVACNGDGRSLALSSNGTEIIKTIEIPNTGGWQDWETVTTDNVALQKGTQIIRFEIAGQDYVNLNYAEFEIISIEEPAEIQLIAGWNIIGYPHKEATSVSNALSSIIEYVEEVKDFDAFYNSEYQDAFNKLKELKWGHGYLIKVSDACTLKW